MIIWRILYCSLFVAILYKNLFYSPVGLRNSEITDFLTAVFDSCHCALSVF